MSRPLLLPPQKTVGSGGIAPTFCPLILSTSSSATYVPSTTLSFVGSTDDNTVIPPDSAGAVSLTQVCTTTNNTFRVQDRSGNTLFTQTLKQFWTASGITFTSVTDPSILFDEYNNRFVVSVCMDAGLSTSRFAIGVSQGSSALSSWYFYTQKVDANSILSGDFPTIGFNNQWIVLSANVYSTPTNASSLFQYGVVWVLNKASAYSGTNVSTYFTPTQVTGLTSVFSMRPARVRDNSVSIMYLVDNNYSLNALRVSTITGPVNAPVLTIGTATTSPTAVSWANGIVTSGVSGGDSFQNFGFQLGGSTSTNVTTNDDRILGVEYRNGYIYTCNTAFFPASAPTFASVMFFQINPTTGVCAQQVFLNDGGPGGNTTSWAFPSVAVNINGDVVIGFTQFDSRSYPSAAYVFQSANDSVGTFHSPMVFQAGLGFYNKIYSPGPYNRWGDYSTTQVDPANGLDFWTFQEYAAQPTSQSEWACKYAQIQLTLLPTPTPTPTLTLTITPTPTTTPSSSSSPVLSIGGIIGVVLGALVFLLLLILLILFLLRKKLKWWNKIFKPKDKSVSKIKPQDGLKIKPPA